MEKHVITGLVDKWLDKCKNVIGWTPVVVETI